MPERFPERIEFKKPNPRTLRILVLLLIVFSILWGTS
jgi:hypothetical protein